MSKLLANTLVILGARVRDAEERAKSQTYFAEVYEKDNKELKEKLKAKDSEVADFKHSYEKTKSELIELRAGLKQLLSKRRKKLAFEKQVEKLLR